MANVTHVTTPGARRSARLLVVLLAVATLFTSMPGCAASAGPRPAVVGERGGVDPLPIGGYGIRSGLSRLLSWAPHAGSERPMGFTAGEASSTLQPRSGLVETGCMGFGFGASKGEVAFLLAAGILLAPVWIPVVLLSLFLPI